MPLQSIIDEKSAIPAGLESFYTEADGKFVLQVEGMKSQKDFDNYAEALKKRFTDAAADFSKNNNADISHDQVAAMIKEQFEKFQAPKPGAKPNGEGDPPGGDVSARLHDLERNAAKSEETINKLTEERDAALGASRSTTIKNALNSAAQKAGATPEGINNLVTLIEPNFEITQDGQVVTKLDSKNTSPNTSPDDFFSAAAREKQYRMFWPASKGAGADTDTGGPGAGGDLGAENPWTIKGWNLTKQGHIYKKDSIEAERLAKAAGVKLGAVAGIR